MCFSERSTKIDEIYFLLQNQVQFLYIFKEHALKSTGFHITIFWYFWYFLFYCGLLFRVIYAELYQFSTL